MCVLEKHEGVFASKLGKVNGTEHRISLKPHKKPLRKKPYRGGPQKSDEIREQFEYRLNAGVIDPSQTEWEIPVLLAPKKDGTRRIVVNLRRHNALTIPETYPLPRMDGCIDSLLRQGPHDAGCVL